MQYTLNEVHGLFNDKQVIKEEDEKKTIEQMQADRKGKRGRPPKHIQAIVELQKKFKSLGPIINPIIYSVLYMIDKSPDNTVKVADVIEYIEKTVDFADEDPDTKKVLKNMSEWERMDLGEKIGEWVIKDSATAKENIDKFLAMGQKGILKKKFFHQTFDSEEKIDALKSTIDKAEAYIQNNVEEDFEIDDFIDELDYPESVEDEDSKALETSFLMRKLMIDMNLNLDRAEDQNAVKHLKTSLKRFVGGNDVLMPMHKEAIYSKADLFEYLDDIKSSKELDDAKKRIDKYSKRKDAILKRFDVSDKEYDKLIASLKKKVKSAKFASELNISDLNDMASDAIKKLVLTNPYFLYNILKASKDPISLIVGDVTAELRQNNYGGFEVKMEQIDKRLFKYFSDGTSKVITEGKKTKLKYRIIT